MADIHSDRASPAPGLPAIPQSGCSLDAAVEIPSKEDPRVVIFSANGKFIARSSPSHAKAIAQFKSELRELRDETISWSLLGVLLVDTQRTPEGLLFSCIPQIVGVHDDSNAEARSDAQDTLLAIFTRIYEDFERTQSGNPDKVVIARWADSTGQPEFGIIESFIWNARS